MRILITGRHGQVSRELQLALADQAELLILGQDQLNLATCSNIRERVELLSPDLIINAAAYTAVDQAESERELAFSINAIAPGQLAEAAANLGVLLIHYSTDYVFAGDKSELPYIEGDATAPLGVYGQSKLAGEEAVRAVGGEHLILRTSWVYSKHGKNFLLTMQRLLQERDELRVVADQIGAPTWAGSIARATAELIAHWRAGRAGPWGTYHLSGLGETSWFGFAEAISTQLRLQGKACGRIDAIPSSAYPTPAQRPINSRLDCSRLQRDWNIRLPDWHSALLECLSSPR